MVELGGKKSNVNLKEPVYYAVKFRIRESAKTAEDDTTDFVNVQKALKYQATSLLSAIEDTFPGVVGKLTLTKDKELYLLLRTWRGQVEKLNFSFNSKFGPFDSIYKLVGSFDKSYIKDEHKMSEKDLWLEIGKKFTDQVVKIRQKPFLQLFAIVSSGYLMHADQVDQFLGFEPTCHAIHKSNAARYLKAKHTLTRWFWGKKAALQKIASERVQRYLDEDKKQLNQVYHFLGADIKSKPK